MTTEGPLSADMLQKMNAYWRAANYLSVGQIYLLDATEPLRPYTLLPTEALNGRGWLVRQDNPAWIPVKATGRYRHTLLLDAALDASGTRTSPPAPPPDRPARCLRQSPLDCRPP